MIKIILTSALSLLMLASQTFASEQTVKQKLIQQLSSVISNINQAKISKTPINGIYEIVLGAEIIYVSADGKFLIQGDIFDITTRRHLTSERKKQLVIKQLDTIKDADKVIFKAKNEKYFIHIFTDVDCPFCQRLHTQVPKLNQLGVTVKYLASPLAQLHPTAFKTMQSIWCADDRVAAMDRYKKTKKYTKKSCDSQAVAQQLALAQNLGVQGTPSIFLNDGTNIPGFVPVERLMPSIEQAAQL